MSQVFNVDCSTGGTSNTPYSAADTAAQQTIATSAQQQSQFQANEATIAANIQTHLAQMETWLSNNPNGAVLTAAQTAFLARMVVGLGRVVLGLLSTVGQAT